MRHPWRWVASAIVLVLAVTIGHSVATNVNFGWSTVGNYLFDGPILSGLRMTLELTVVSMAIGILLGVVAAVMRLSPNPLVSSASWLYVWVFRGTPLLVQLLLWANIAALFPKGISLGIPLGPQFVHFTTNTVITPFVAGILGLGLNEGAYMSEIVRAGIISVDEGQTEAAHSLGMTRLQTMRRIVLPQAMRVIIPPTGNETISMLKNTSLVIVVPITDLLESVTNVYSRTYQVIPLLLVASIWYLIVTTLLSVGQYYVERYYGRGAARALPETPLQRLRRNLLSFGKRPPALPFEPPEAPAGPHG